MKKFLYVRLALHGMTKNRKLYLPYLLSCAGTVMMFYMLSYLTCSPFLKSMPGGDSMQLILSLGQIVIAVFALLFLLYTNSFLIRRRFREFGLYSVLGMDRKGNLKIVFCESVITAALSLLLGLFFGIVFSKLAELAFLYVVHGDVNMDFAVPARALTLTVGIFIVIFSLLALRSAIRILRSRPLALLRSEQQGEKPPRANAPAAITGLLLLAGAYALAVTIRSPLSALLLFFVAVLMVIAGTYLLFIAGSVAVCRLLQQKKSYYFRKDHFFSVSSMVFRMKRNGAGLASVCILSTMVLVMCSSTASLYIGTEDTMRVRYPLQTEFTVRFGCPDAMTDEVTAPIRKACESVLRDHHAETTETMEYRYADITGLITGDVCDPTASMEDLVNIERVRNLFFISVDDYNRLMGTGYTLEGSDTLLYTLRCDYAQDTLQIGDLKLSVTGTVDRFVSISQANTVVLPAMMFVISDYSVLEPLTGAFDPLYNTKLLGMAYTFCYSTDLPEEEAISVYRTQTDALRMLIQDSAVCSDLTAGCVYAEAGDFYGTFGGLFYIGIVLSVIFILAVAVIIYYKQICEGYEDQARYAILRKVGMDRDDIRKSVNAQIRVVFSAPLILAGVHLLFAFPLVWKLLQLFSLKNLSLVICVTAAAYLLFAVFYAVIYRLTARGYYEIVTGEQIHS